MKKNERKKYCVVQLQYWYVTVFLWEQEQTKCKTTKSNLVNQWWLFSFLGTSYLHVCLCTISVPRSGHWMPWGWSYRPAHVRVLGIRSESSEKADSVLKHWVIPKPSGPVSFIGVTYKSGVKNYLQKNKGLNDSCIILLGWGLMMLET